MAGLLAALLFSLVETNPARSADPPCVRGERAIVETGIVKANGCWTKVASGQGFLYTGKFADQPAGTGIDLNGFILTKPDVRKAAGEGITIDTGTQIAKTLGKAQFNSANWPLTGLNQVGEPIALNFTAPKFGKLILDDLRLGSNSAFNRGIAGFIPVGNLETPIVIREQGKGSMNITLALSGIFTLKGKAQSTTVTLPTEIGKGTRLDGFKLELNEVDAFKAVILENLVAYYSAAGEKFGGEASVRLPFFSKDPSKREGKGATVGFGIEKGRLTNAKFGVVGLKIPIGAPPSGFVTSLAGGFEMPASGDLLFNASMGATIGPEIPVPWDPAGVAPIDLEAAIKLGVKNKELYFRFDGGLKLFKLPIGQAYLGIYFNTGMEFGATVGLGLPSFKNRENDPFYLGARVDGWVTKNKFQFSGSGTFALFGVKLLNGQALFNQQVIGACWKVFWFDGGAVYDYRRKSTSTFGTTCGLDRYREQFPGGRSASISVSSPRSFTLDSRQVIVAVEGQGGAPRFSLRSPSGEVFKAPEDREGVMRDDHGFFIDEENEVTNVVLKKPAGEWTLIPYGDSPPITSVEAGEAMPPEKVTARVVGQGRTRTLIWDSKGQPNTELVFTELIRNGVENPIFTTARESGRKRFKVENGMFGKRRLGVIVMHGDAPRQEQVVNTYMVKPPPPPGAPQKVRAWRDQHDVTVTWRGAKGASSYLVQVTMPGVKSKSAKSKASFVRFVGHRSRHVTFRNFPGGAAAKAKVIAFNYANRQGPAQVFKFRTNPPSLGFKAAVRRGARSGRLSGNGVRLKTICLNGAHCRVQVKLFKGKRRIGSTRYQQVPDTYQHLKVRPTRKADRRKLLRGNTRNLRVVVIERRGGATYTASRRLSPGT